MEVLEKKINGLNVCVIDKNDKEFPEECKNLKGFPDKLYYVGKLPDFNKGSFVCVSGARACSDYGAELSKAVSMSCVSNNINLVTGLSLGCETSALLGSLSLNKPCTAVLFSGVDVCYPQYNQEIYNKILETGGCIISPFPLGEMPLPNNIFMKHKVLAGLCDTFVLVEATKKSGCINLCEQFLEYGKDTFACAGRVGDCLAEGPNYLIKQGAFILSEVDDILKYYNICDNQNFNKKRVDLENLDYFQQLIVDELSDGKCSYLDEIASSIKVPYEKCRSVLTSLCVLGIAKETSPLHFSLENQYINFKDNEENLSKIKKNTSNGR